MFFFSSRRRHTRSLRDWSSDVCSSDLIRANTLARGNSGVRVETLEALLEMLNRGLHPVIPEKGSLGASGDLAPLAHMRSEERRVGKECSSLRSLEPKQ